MIFVDERSILIISNNTFKLDFYQEILKSLYAVTLCMEPRKSFRAIKSIKPDLIMVDTETQGDRWDEIAEGLNQGHVDIPILLFGDNLTKGDVVLALKLGVRDILEGDLTKFDVRKSIEDIFHQSHRSSLLKKSRESFHTLINKNPVGLVVVSKDNKLKFLNYSASKMLNGLGKPLLVGQELPISLEQGDVFETGIIEANSSPGIAEIRQSTTVWLGVESILLTIQNVTRKRKSESKFALAVETSANAACMLDSQGFVMKVNDLAIDLLKIQEDEFKGVEFSSLLDSEVRNIFAGSFYKTLQSMVPSRVGLLERIEIENSTSRIPVELFLTPLITDDGYFVLVSIFDIQERVKIEEGLKRAWEEAEAASEAKTAFLANISHEIRTPLNAILAMSDLLLETHLEGPQVKLVNSLEKASENLLALVDDVLDLSKIEAQELKLDIEQFDLVNLVKSVFEIYSFRGKQKHLDMQLKIGSGLDTLFNGDSLRIKQILSNLLSNAIKFTSEGLVNMEVACLDQSIVFTITDTGIGIDTENLDSVFESFSQGDVSITKNYGGTGLGLTIVKSLCHLMHGSVRVESEVGTGSVFIVDLPLPRVQGSKGSGLFDEVKKEVPTIQKKSGHILLAEDNSENRQIFELYLKDSPLTFDFAFNGEQAFHMYKKKHYDLILMDLQMPDMDGYDATLAIRWYEQEMGRVPVPILALTASVLKSQKDRALRVGCNAFLTKPIKKKALLEAIYKHLSREIIIDSAKEPIIEASIEEAVHRVIVFVEQDLADLIPGYLENRKKDVVELRTLAMANNYETISQIAHKIAGTGSGFGFDELSKVGKSLENAAIAKDHTRILRLIDEVDNYIDNVEVKYIDENAS